MLSNLVRNLKYCSPASMFDQEITVQYPLQTGLIMQAAATGVIQHFWRYGLSVLVHLKQRSLFLHDQLLFEPGASQGRFIPRSVLGSSISNESYQAGLQRLHSQGVSGCIHLLVATRSRVFC